LNENDSIGWNNEVYSLSENELNPQIVRR